jgi:hypothetical protein
MKFIGSNNYWMVNEKEIKSYIQEIHCPKLGIGVIWLDMQPILVQFQ